MRKFVFAAAAAAVMAVSAFAMDPMAGTFGNKVLVTNAAKEVTTYWFNADKSVKIKTVKGEDANATWAISADSKQICLTAVLPAGAKAPEGGVKPACSEFVGAKKPGDKWTQKDAEGKDVGVEIVAGM